jgi:hypothetical protein
VSQVVESLQMQNLAFEPQYHSLPHQKSKQNEEESGKLRQMVEGRETVMAAERVSRRH